MEVRGSVLMSINDYVKTKHADQYDKWWSNLSDESQSLIERAKPQDWYPVEAGVLDPTSQMCQMFYPNIKRGAWDSGRFSAEVALTGIFKVFVLISTPAFLLKRATRVITNFYAPTNIEVVNSTSKSMLLHITKLPLNHELLEYRIGGWMEKALEICGCSNLILKIDSALSKGDPYTAYNISWD